MQPEIHVAGLTIQTFGICFALAFAACGLVAARRFRELGKPVDWAYEIVFAALVGGLVGARLDYIIENWDSAKHDLLGSIFSGSGLVWLGGVVGGAIGVLLWAWRRGFLGLALLDACAPLLALGYAGGRIGCQVSGDGDYGKASDLPWAMAYPHGTKPIDTKVHPTPIYETLTMGLIALALWQLRDRVRPGILFALWLLLSGLERVLVEFIRRNDHAALGLTLPQLISVAMAAVGAAWLLRARRPLWSSAEAPA
ncbi:MAG: phosphatidylglycerol---prolipoprotein diacylglyceryl transferase [Thermoleophilaceae bacterium]|nr:phosphatidylglycerol---prolipoprotein diacylglyceryl transferase [Thermoleophilaceae bacterium]